MTDLQPGKELDAIIANKVMGLDLSKYRQSNYFSSIDIRKGYDGCYGYYSTEISAAWEVVERLENNFRFMLTRNYKTPANSSHYCWARFQDKYQRGLGTTHSHSGISESASHAICLAALNAIGYKHEKD